MSSAEEDLLKLEKEKQEIKAKLNERQRAADAAKVKATEKRTPTTREKDSLKKVFDTYDTDKSGFIDRNELKNMVDKLGCSMTDAELTAVISGLDANADNKISFDEFIVWWTSDKKLGGNSGVRLAAMKAKLAAELILQDMEKRKAEPIKQVSEDITLTKFKVRTAEALKKVALSAGVTVMPFSKEVFAVAMKDLTKGTSVPLNESEDGTSKWQMAGSLGIKLTDAADPDATLAQVKGMYDMVSGEFGSDLSADFAVKDRVLTIRVFTTELGSLKHIMRRLSQDYGCEDPNQFNTELLFDLISLTFESEFDLFDAATLASENHLFDLFDSFVFSGTMEFRKDWTEYMILAAMERNFDRVFRESVLIPVFGTLMLATLKSELIVNSFNASVAKVATNVARRFSSRFKANLQRMKEKGVVDDEKLKDPEAVQAITLANDEEKLIKYFTAVMMMNYEELNVPLRQLPHELHKETAGTQYRLDEAGPFLDVFANFSEITNFNLLTQWFAVKVGLQGVKPFKVLPLKPEERTAAQNLGDLVEPLKDVIKGLKEQIKGVGELARMSKDEVEAEN
eukprot:PhF_6_TR24763/c0_g1_i1/m.33976